MRILHVIAGVAAESGGPTEVLRQMTAELARRGHSVSVLTTDAAGAGRRYQPGGPGQAVFDPAVHMDVQRALRAWVPYPSGGHLLGSWRAPTAFDVAHVHGVFTLPVSLAMAAFRARGFPYLLRPCGMLDSYSLRQRQHLKAAWMMALDRPNLLGAAHIQASTEHEAEAVRALMSKPLHSRIVVLPQGVATPLAASGRRPHARPYLLFLSRIARKKGLIGLVDAFALIVHAHPELDLVLAGPDEAGHRAEVEARVQALGIADRVVFVGSVAGSDKSDWFAAAEAFVLPSLDENFGVVVIEAAHHGTPVIVSSEVGLAPAVRRHGAGRVTTLAPADLAAALNDVLATGRTRFAAGLAALAAEHAWPHLIERLETLYRDALGNSRPRIP